MRGVDADERRDGEEEDHRANQPVEHREGALSEQVDETRQRRHERVLDRPLPALPRDRLGHELEDDPEEGPDRRADEQSRRQPVLAGGGQVLRTRDEDDRERVRDRPDHEREIPEEVALREIDVPLDDPEQADELVAHLYGVSPRSDPGRAGAYAPGRLRRAYAAAHGNTSRYSSSRF